MTWRRRWWYRWLERFGFLVGWIAILVFGGLVILAGINELTGFAEQVLP